MAKKKLKHLPPRWAESMLMWVCPSDLVEEIQGDLQEQFAINAEQSGTAAAKRKYILEVAKFARPYFLKRKFQTRSRSFAYPKTYITNPDMIKNYFKIAFRNSNRNRGYTLINLSGLAIGMAMAIIISLWVWDEWNYNRSSQNYKTIGRVMSHFNQNGTIVSSQNMPFPLAAELKNNFAADFEHVCVSWSTEEYNLLFGEDRFRKKAGLSSPMVPVSWGLKCVVALKVR